MTGRSNAHPGLTPPNGALERAPAAGWRLDVEVRSRAAHTCAGARVGLRSSVRRTSGVSVVPETPHNVMRHNPIASREVVTEFLSSIDGFRPPES